MQVQVNYTFHQEIKQIQNIYLEPLFLDITFGEEKSVGAFPTQGP